MSADRATRIYRISLGILVGSALIVSLHGQAAQPTTATWQDDEVWRPRQEKSVPGVNAPVRPRRPDAAEQNALRSAPEVMWPSPGTADVAVPRRETQPAAIRRSGQRNNLPRAQAGNLPIWIGPATGQSERRAVDGPARVRVDLLERRQESLLLRLTRADGVDQPGSLSLLVDYSAFRHAFGGDWAVRLRLVRLPDCVLTTPESPACVGTPVPTRNDGSGALSADVPADGLFAMQAGPSGGAGDFKESSLSPTATWQVGGSSGDFNWSYPMDAPPSAGGPSVNMTLDYSSGSVDGRTSATNNQTSWVGEGFDLAPGGAIERRYASCGTKWEKTGNNGSRATGDLCFATDNATFTLNGRGGELVRDDQTGTWHPRSDDGSKVERLSGRANGDDGSDGAENAHQRGEYWKLTTKDGTQYFFGLHQLPGFAAGKPTTNSVWTVPVYGNHPNEQCHKADFPSSWCAQAYRWNLDYVVDTHGNTMSFFYDTELNYYARNVTASAPVAYHRAGNLKRIEYGQRHNQVYATKPVAQVLFTTAERCIAPCSTAEPTTYPDTPLDQTCMGPNNTKPTSCENKFSPTFWTRKRLAKVTTQVQRGGVFTDVDSWTFRHTFEKTGDGANEPLWLEGVTAAGHVGGVLAAPEMTFDGEPMPNRVDGLDNLLPLNRWRITAVHYGTGGELAVKYSEPDCKPGDVPAPDTNGRRCHPLKWTPEGQAERTDWFHKYVVTQVTESDRVTELEPVVTQVDYLTPAAWRHDEEDGLVEIGRKTWSQWRGYELVRVRKGHPSGPQTISENRYFRGMDGDKRANGTPKEVEVKDSTGVAIRDVNALAGQVREQLSYNGSTMIERKLTDQWLSAPTATRKRSWGTTQALIVLDHSLRQDEATADGWLTTRNSLTHNAAGVVVQAEHLNDVSTAADDTCRRYDYASNPSAGIVEMPARVQTVAVACARAWTNADVIRDERIYYDGSPTPGGTPTRGDATKAERLSGFDPNGQPTYQTVFTAEYDVVGRRTATTNALGQIARIAYTPADGSGPVTRAVSTQPNGHQTTTDYEPAWGEELGVTEPDGRRTDLSYDPIGHRTKVWLPGRNKATDGPNIEYGYLSRADGPNVVSTRTLQADGSYRTEYDLFDGLLRPRQTQEPAAGGGRVITDSRFDSRGLETTENGPYYDDAPPGTEVYLPEDPAGLPTQELTEYDGAERPTTITFRSEGADKWKTTQSSYADRVTIDPPEGEQPATQIFDAEGRLVELRQYLADSPTGAYDKTAYTYTRAGLLASVTDPAGNVWRFDYDTRGRRIREVDPDKGTTTYTYNDIDQVTSTTDANGTRLAYGYDEIGRRTAVHDQSLTGPKRAEWTYDTLAKGSPTSATRFVDGHPYAIRVTGYEPSGQPTGMRVTIPSAEGALAGDYTLSRTYKPDGEIATETLPAIGDLPAETLQFGYNSEDLPTTLSSQAGTYVADTEYTPYGEQSVVTLAQQGGKWVQQKYEYEVGTRRLARAVTVRELLPRQVADVGYEYDPAGNVTKITDTPSPELGEPADTQCFRYDHQRRLSAAWTPGSGDCNAAPTVAGLGGPAPYWHSWTFDKSGNRTGETRRSPAGTTTSSYQYPEPGQAHPHAVQQVSTTGPAGTTTKQYDYDAVGNTTRRTIAGAGETLTWDAEGHLAKVTAAGRATSFVYDADGQRLLRRDASGTTLYLGQSEVLLKPDGTLSGTRYYSHGNKGIAVRTGGKLTWLGHDHHGSAHIAIDAATQQVERRRTDPYGNSRGTPPAAWPGQRDFVGGTADPSTGLVHLGAREYDPTLGRFISVDPIADYGDPQQLDGYSYARNNPVSFTDPDGLLAVPAVPVVAVAVVLALVIIVVAAVFVVWHTIVVPILVEVAIQVGVTLARGLLGLIALAVFAKAWVTKWVEQRKQEIKRTFERIKRWIRQRVSKPAARANNSGRARSPDRPKSSRSEPAKARPPRPPNPNKRSNSAGKQASSRGRHSSPGKPSRPHNGRHRDPSNRRADTSSRYPPKHEKPGYQGRHRFEPEQRSWGDRAGSLHGEHIFNRGVHPGQYNGWIRKAGWWIGYYLSQLLAELAKEGIDPKPPGVKDFKYKPGKEAFS